VILLTLPYPPSANKLYRHVGPRVLLSAAGRVYYAEVAKVVAELRFRTAVRFPIRGRIAVMIDSFVPDRRRRDLDNMQKAACDSLTKAGVWTDDSQIDDLRIRRMPVDRRNPRIEVSIGEP